MGGSETVFNLDELTCGYVQIAKTVGGRVRTWRLRDDVETRILLRGFQLDIGNTMADRARKMIEERQAQAKDPTATPLGAAQAAQLLADVMDDYQRDVREFFLQIARWTYPAGGPDGQEAEELTDALSHDERDRIIGHFFTLRFGSLNAQLASLRAERAETGAEEASQEPKQRPASRGSRRGGGRASTRPM